VIATLDDVSVIRVDFPVPERQLSSLPAGARITATADALPGETFRGAVALLDTRVNETSRAVTARAEFDNSAGLLRPGMLMRVNVTQGERRAAAVPEAAILFEADQAFVFRIVETDGALRAKRAAVQTG